VLVSDITPTRAKSNPNNTMKGILFNSLTYILISMLPITVTAQNVYFGISGSIDYNSYRNIDKVGPSSYKGKINYCGGVVIQYNLNEKVSLKTKLIYATKNFQETIDLTMLIPIDPNDPVLTQEDEATIDYFNKFIEIPIELNYKLNKSKTFDLISSLGLVNSFQIDHDYKASESISVNNPKSYNDYLLGLKTGLGFLFRTNDVGIYFEPRIGVYLNTVHSSFPEKNPIQFGLEIQVLKI